MDWAIIYIGLSSIHSPYLKFYTALGFYNKSLHFLAILDIESASKAFVRLPGFKPGMACWTQIYWEVPGYVIGFYPPVI